MKWDHFYEGLNLEYWQMLAHKVDSENPAGYSDLLLAMRMLERTEARDPLPPKTAVTSVSNLTHFQTSWNLFLSCMLKSNYTFTAWAATIGSNEVEENSGAKQEGDGQTASSADKEAKTSGGLGGMDQPVEYIVCFAKAVKLYQQKNRSCFGCRSSDHLMRDCPKDISKPAQKADLNTKDGMAEKGAQASKKSMAAHQTSPDETLQA